MEGEAVAGRDRRGVGWRAGAARPDRGEHVARQLLGLLDVGLVERVDAEDGSGDRGGDLPADELGAEVDRVGEVDPDDRVAGRLESCRQGRRGRRRRDPSRAIRTNARSSPYASTPPSGSRSTGTIPTPCLPVLSAMSCSSHAPKLAISSSARNVSLSRPARGERPDGQAERDARVGGRVRLAAGAQHRRGRREQRRRGRSR